MSWASSDRGNWPRVCKEYVMADTMLGFKPALLLHVCCGPCSIALLEELQNRFAVTVYYTNSNIHPQEEYEKRRTQALEICKDLGIPFLDAPYCPDTWFAWAEHLADEAECGKRCEQCFAMRLEQTAQQAEKLGFAWYGSTLTSGRNKKAAVINPLGKRLGELHNVLFIEEDWKKKGRQEVSNRLCKEKQIYRQSYCGCLYSKKN